MKPENKNMLVRGKVVIGNNACGFISETNPLCIVATTHYYRHDDNLKKLEKDLQNLVSVYSKMDKTTTLMCSYEYKEYR